MRMHNTHRTSRHRRMLMYAHAMYAGMTIACAPRCQIGKIASSSRRLHAIHAAQLTEGHGMQTPHSDAMACHMRSSPPGRTLTAAHHEGAPEGSHMPMRMHMHEGHARTGGPHQCVRLPTGLIITPPSSCLVSATMHACLSPREHAYLRPPAMPSCLHLVHTRVSL